MSFTEWITSLNGIDADAKSDVRRQITSRWGAINLPTLFHIVDDILLQADAHGWDAISLYKKDIKAAFHRLLFHPDSACLTAFALDELYTILHLVGNFGWTGTPFAWDVVGRIMKAAAKCTIQGTLRLYVDDFFGACLTTMLRANNRAVDTVIVTLLGPEALAPKKDKSGRSLVILGWDFDLDARTVSISESNLLSTLHAFMDIGDCQKVSLLQLERAASLATRYSVLARPMLAFTSALYIQGHCGFQRQQNHSTLPLRQLPRGRLPMESLPHPSRNPPQDIRPPARLLQTSSATLSRPRFRWVTTRLGCRHQIDPLRQHPGTHWHFPCPMPPDH
jgi:hypothetical protein